MGWIIEFIAAVGFMVIAFCTAIWFFAPRPDGADAKSEERETPPNTLSKAIKMTMCHHLGTVATGSLIIAVVQMIRVMLEYAEKKQKELGLSDNPFVKFIFCVLRCCMWCLEKCVRWLNKHVYIQVVISGCWFCTGICKVCRALYNNLGYISMCGYVSTAMLWFGKIAISLSTAAIGVTACEHRELSSVFFPAFVMAVIGFGIAIMFCEVYELVIDTMLMCFCEAKMNNSGCIPSRLESMMEENYQKSKEAAVAEGMARLAAAEAENADSKESKEPQGIELDPVKTKVEEVPTSNGELSKPLLDEMHSKFERYDLDGSNSINSHEELQQLMVNLYFALSTKGIPNVRPEEIASRVESAGDMEKNNWSFDEWSSGVQLKFPEICEYKG